MKSKKWLKVPDFDALNRICGSKYDRKTALEKFKAKRSSVSSSRSSPTIQVPEGEGSASESSASQETEFFEGEGSVSQESAVSEESGE